ncbi:tRNA (adenosine(37)-N6)-dimethylallyltransferase MiaA [Gammaproteobacteria bacterium]|nr:tRNA (adenosine(37)-N6)-dimethylallyltransferase MiaA [Gammaproteobacteria bacterium]
MSNVFFLMGPTASGKTDLAIELVSRYPFEIISVDSAMVYRDMNIGTAKPNSSVLLKTPHKLIDICNPDKKYSAAKFYEDSLSEIKLIHSRGNIPLLVGGTMMYFKSLINGLAVMPDANLNLRNKILLKAENKGWPKLHDDLTKVDPEAANRIHPHDSQRIQRALEVFAISGKTITELHAEQNINNTNYNFINIIINPDDRFILHKRIVERFKHMIEIGFIDEVVNLKQKYTLSDDMPSIRSVGYRQIWGYLAGIHTHQEMMEKGIIATRQLAKRQLTWLRRWPNANFFNSESNDFKEKIFDSIDSSLMKN